MTESGSSRVVHGVAAVECVTVSAGRLFAPKGRRVVATGGVRRSRTQPLESGRKNGPAPEGRRKRIGPGLLRPCRGGRGGAFVSTGSAWLAWRRAPLHPWLQSSVPPGPSFRRRFAHAPVLLFWLLSVGVAVAESPVDRFVASLKTNETLSEQGRDLIRSSWEKCTDCDGAEFLLQGLALLSPEFRSGLDAYDADRYAPCVTIMSGLRGQPNRFVAMNAAAYEIKALVALDRLSDAGERIEQLLSADAAALEEHTYLAGEILFLRGYCLLANLQYERARETLERFLATYPDAGQRLTVSAQQMLSELSNREPGQIGEVVDLMNYSGRRLRHQESGTVVQQKQQRVVDLLDGMIEEAEQQEQSASSSGGGGSNSRSGSRSGQQRAPNPMQESKLPGGSASQESLREARRANPADAWGRMPPAQRERILQALRDSFPGKYRELVEQYYEDLAKRP